MQVKRGDTLIEVMFAIAIFSLVAVISVVMMNAGVSTGERSLELVVARNELNAQAEALRFIHSSYISELTLPKCNEPGLPAGEKCQQYEGLWKTIIGGAQDSYTIPSPLTQCKDAYEIPEGGTTIPLADQKAFVLNTRLLNLPSGTAVTTPTTIYVPFSTTSGILAPATLGARIIYVQPIAVGGVGVTTPTSDDSFSTATSTSYNQIGRAEGIWVVAVKGPSDAHGPKYYDFYIQTCWYGSNLPAPTSIDTVIRLFNPEGL